MEGVYQGLAQALDRHGGQLLGGDCSGGLQRLLAITALGRLGPAGAIRRCDGRPGDRLVCTGPHGLSRLGLALLRQEPMPPSLPLELQQQAVTAHRRPVPRHDAVATLEQTRPAGLSWRVGGTDSSDGLAAAVAAIARASRCDALLDRHGLPMARGMDRLAQAEAWCLGEVRILNSSWHWIQAGRPGFWRRCQEPRRLAGWNKALIQPLREMPMTIKGSTGQTVNRSTMNR